MKNLTEEQIKNFSRERTREDSELTQKNLSILINIYEDTINKAIQNYDIENLNNYIDTYLKLIELVQYYNISKEIKLINRNLDDLCQAIRWLR